MGGAGGLDEDSFGVPGEGYGQHRGMSRDTRSLSGVSTGNPSETQWNYWPKAAEGTRRGD